MLPYDKYAEHTFLSAAWSEKLRKAGVNMDDAVYFLMKNLDGNYEVLSKTELETYVGEVKAIPTYTLPDLIYKLDEFPFVNGIGCPLEFIKDAPFYIWCYYFNNGKKTDEKAELPKFNNGKSYIEAYAEKPLEAAAAMLVACMNNGIGCVDDISGKYAEEW